MIKRFLILCALAGFVAGVTMTGAKAQEANPQEPPCRWNYQNVSGVATAIYCGNVQVNGTINSSLPTATNVANLTSFPNKTVGTVIFLEGYYSINDGGQGELAAVSGSLCDVNGNGADNGQTFCMSSGGSSYRTDRYWKRQTSQVSALNAAWYGASPSSTGAQNTAAMIACLKAASAVGGTSTGGGECDLPTLAPGSKITLAGAITTVNAASYVALNCHKGTLEQSTANVPVIEFTQNSGYPNSLVIQDCVMGYSSQQPAGNTYANAVDFAGAMTGGTFFVKIDNLFCYNTNSCVGTDPSATNWLGPWEANLNQIYGTPTNGLINFCKGTGGNYGAPALNMSLIYEQGENDTAPTVQLCGYESVHVDGLERNLAGRGTIQAPALWSDAGGNGQVILNNVRLEAETYGSNLQYNGLITTTSQNFSIKNFFITSATFSSGNFMCAIRTVGTNAIAPVIQGFGISNGAGTTFTGGSILDIACPDATRGKVTFLPPTDFWPVTQSAPFAGNVKIADNLANVNYPLQTVVSLGGCTISAGTSYASCGNIFTRPQESILTGVTVCLAAGPSSGTLSFYVRKNGVSLGGGGVSTTFPSGGSNTCRYIALDPINLTTAASNDFTSSDFIDVESGTAPASNVTVTGIYTYWTQMVP